MKRMIDNKDYENLKKDVADINEVVEEHITDFIITSVVVDDGVVLGSQVKDVENDVTYNLPLGSQVEANPELEGGESALESIGIDGTNYSIGGGKKLYRHNVKVSSSSQTLSGRILNCYFSFICDVATAFDIDTFKAYIDTKNYNNFDFSPFNAQCYYIDNSNVKHWVGGKYYKNNTAYGFGYISDTSGAIAWVQNATETYLTFNDVAEEL
jgi:hypothetical protein